MPAAPGSEAAGWVGKAMAAVGLAEEAREEAGLDSVQQAMGLGEGAWAAEARAAKAGAAEGWVAAGWAAGAEDPAAEGWAD